MNRIPKPLKMYIPANDNCHLKVYVHWIVTCSAVFWPGMFYTAGEVDIAIYLSTIGDRLSINQPSDAKCKFWVRPKITTRSARGRYLVYVVGVIYGVLATLCRSTKRQLGIVSPRAI